MLFLAVLLLISGWGLSPLAAAAVDLASLADHVFTVFEGGFILTRAMDEPAHLPAQLAHVRHYLELLFALSPGQFERGRRRTATA